MKNFNFAQTIIAAVVTSGFISVVVLLIARPTSWAIDANTTSLLNILLGVLAAQFAAVVQFYIGSSAGSKAKDETLREIATNGQQSH